MCGGATTKIRYVIFEFDMLSEIITFEEKGRYCVYDKHSKYRLCWFVDMKQN